jgi:ABC-type lipoprotein export system ATPase subunit
MLTSLLIRNFKRFETAEIELGETVVLIGPNNSGKTTALQALALWDVGRRQWLAKRGDKPAPKKRPGVTINRRDLVSAPVPTADLLWRDLHLREGVQLEGKPKTRNIRIDVETKGVTAAQAWTCGFEFDYINEESIVCRPMRERGYDDVPVEEARFTTVPPGVGDVKVAYLPPMSGLADREFIKQPGEVGFLVGQGQTAQVLRNLCYRVYAEQGQGSGPWKEIVDRVAALFGAKLLPPQLVREGSEIVMPYEERGVTLDLSCAGRGLQQTLLLLAYLYANPGTVLLLDEPDAHLEILRQRQTYQLITEVARNRSSQIIAASHSEVVLNEAADRDVVIALVGRPHRIDDRGSQVLKSLKSIGFEHYYLAEQTGWVLYLEGSTDLEILRAWARVLQHAAGSCLGKPFVHYVGNQARQAESHFFGLREAKRDLVGLAILDQLDRGLPPQMSVETLTWKRREIENYLCAPDVLLAFARQDDLPLLGEQRAAVMQTVIHDLVPPIALRDSSHSWWSTVKASTEFLDPLFAEYYRRQSLPNLMAKSDYHRLASLMRAEDVDAEVSEKLDAIVRVAALARPLGEA